MDHRLLQLIRDYQAAVKAAVKLLVQSGIERPASDLRWLRTRIPQRGLLAGDAHYFKHGIGCTVYLPDGELNFDFDFDFAGSGQVDWFVLWRLTQYASARSRS